MSHILVNTLYYCKRKKKLMNFYLVPKGCLFSLILFSDCITLSLTCHAIPLHQDSKICDTKQSITEKKNQIDKN